MLFLDYIFLTFIYAPFYIPKSNVWPITPSARSGGDCHVIFLKLSLNLFFSYKDSGETMYLPVIITKTLDQDLHTFSYNLSNLQVLVSYLFNNMILVYSALHCNPFCMQSSFITVTADHCLTVQLRFIMRIWTRVAVPRIGRGRDKHPFGT